MNYHSKIAMVSVLLCISLLMSVVIAADDECKVQYQSCIKTAFDKHWALWDDRASAKLTISHDDFDARHIDNQFNLLACDEVTDACKANREPDVKKYLEQR
jgi:hypothetical protein